MTSLINFLRNTRKTGTVSSAPPEGPAYSFTDWRHAAVPFGLLTKTRLLKGELDYHLVRASMVIIYFFFGYQKWFDYEAQGLIPFFTHGPLIFWMYPVFGIKGSSYFLGVSEWLFGALLLAGFWNKKLGVLGALGSIMTFLCTVTIIPFMPDGWAKSAGGFPAMVGNVAFLMKDVVLLAVSVYLFKQDLLKVTLADESARHERHEQRASAASLVKSMQAKT